MALHIALGDFITFTIIGVIELTITISWVVLVYGCKIAPNKNKLLKADGINSKSDKNLSDTTKASRNAGTGTGTGSENNSKTKSHETNIEITNTAAPTNPDTTELETKDSPPLHLDVRIQNEVNHSRDSRDSRSLNSNTPENIKSDDTKIEIELEKETAHRRVKRRVKKMPMISKMHSKAKLLTTLSLICACIYLISNSVAFVETNINYELGCVIDAIDTLSGISQRWFLYWYFLERIELTFGNTMFSMGEKKHRFFKILLNVTFSVTCTLIIGGDIYHCAAKGGETLVQVQIFVALLNDLFWALTLMIMFVWKLRSLIKMSESFGESAKKNESSVQAVKDLKYLMSKSCILIVVTVVSTWIATGSFAGTTIWSFIGVDFIVNSMCLILSFAFMDDWYKLLCWPCRICCEKE